MNRIVKFVGPLWLTLMMLAPCSPARAAGFRQPDREALPEVFQWTDTCNVWVLRDGASAILIDLGDGSVLEHLAEIGIQQLDWILFTHHHREQCQGAAKLAAWRARGTKVAAPESERPLFESPATYRKMTASLEDPFTVYGSSFVRPPIAPIPLDRSFKTNENFQWRAHRVRCLDTKGNSPGSMTYLLKAEAGLIAFSGDVMLAGGKMHTWFDTEWDYGFGAGIQALRNSVATLADQKPAWVLPSHGESMRDPLPLLRAYGQRLEQFEKLYVRGYGVEKLSAAYQDKVSKPTTVTNVWQVTPHLFKFKRPNFWPNFVMVLADNGRALLMDCGLLDEKFLDTALEGLRTHYGLKAIDAFIVSHMHGDHFLEAPHLREKWGTPIWALDRMVDKMEHPERFDYAAPIQAYDKKASDGSRILGVHVDRAFKSGESFEWEGYKFTIDWMPGQTEFALCLNGMIDGRKVAFTGDNIFGDPDDPSQTGHEAMVAHNSAILEEGYIYGAEYLKRLSPDLIMGGHSFVMDHPAAFIERYRRWACQMRDAFQSLSSEEDYRYGFDPFWVRAEPYRIVVRPGGTAEVSLHVRNFLTRAQAHRIEVHSVAGLSAAPRVLDAVLEGEGRQAFPVQIQAASDASSGVHTIAFDVTVDGRRRGERFDLIVEVKP